MSSIWPSKQYRSIPREVSNQAWFHVVLVRACVDALKLIPQVNAEVRATISFIATTTTLALCGAAERTGRSHPAQYRTSEFADIERAIADFAERAQATS